jgi:nucleoside-diphosphate-sugar epimerase
LSDLAPGAEGIPIPIGIDDERVFIHADRVADALKLAAFHRHEPGVAFSDR